MMKSPPKKSPSSNTDVNVVVVGSFREPTAEHLADFAKVQKCHRTNAYFDWNQCEKAIISAMECIDSRQAQDFFSECLPAIAKAINVLPWRECCGDDRIRSHLPDQGKVISSISKKIVDAVLYLMDHLGDIAVISAALCVLDAESPIYEDDKCRDSAVLLEECREKFVQGNGFELLLQCVRKAKWAELPAAVREIQMHMPEYLDQLLEELQMRAAEEPAKLEEVAKPWEEIIKALTWGLDEPSPLLTPDSPKRQLSRGLWDDPFDEKKENKWKLPSDPKLMDALERLKVEYLNKKENLIQQWLDVNGYLTVDEACNSYDAPVSVDGLSRPSSSMSFHSFASEPGPITQMQFSNLSWGDQLQVIHQIMSNGDSCTRVLSWFIRKWGRKTLGDARSAESSGTEKDLIRMILARLSGLSGTDLMLHLQALAVLSEPEENQAVVAKEGGTMLILGTMTANPDTAAVQEHACLALSSLSINADIAALIGRQGGIPLILTAMQRHVSDANLQATACAALGNLSLTDENKKLVTKDDLGINLVLSAMKNHPGDFKVQEHACVVIANLSVDPDVSSLIARNGGIALIVAAMEDCMNDVAVCAHTCAALANLSVSMESKAVVLRDGLQAVFDTMRSHPSNETVIAHACGLISNLASLAENKATIGREGGVTIVMRALKTHINSHRVAANACGALSSLVGNTGNAEVALREGALDIVHSAMKIHPTVLKLQQTATSTIRQLLPSKDIDGDKIRLYLACLRSYVEDPRIVENLCFLLARIPLKSDAIATIPKEGGAVLMSDLFRKYVGRVRVLREVASVLELVIITTENTDLSPRANFIDSLLDALSSHRSDIDVQRPVFALLDSIATKDSARAKIAEMLEIILSTLNDFLADENLQRYGASLLGTLSLDESVNLNIVTHGGVATLLKMLERHPNNVRLNSFACSTLGSLAIYSENAEIMKNMGVATVLLKMMKNFPFENRIQSSGCAGILSLIRIDPSTPLDHDSLVSHCLETMVKLQDIRVLEISLELFVHLDSSSLHLIKDQIQQLSRLLSNTMKQNPDAERLCANAKTLLSTLCKQ